ncbi:unnamed protein product [Closterium sp. NIES-64]|nr:unnamed protein product [Closterium sp. NIES-64]
MSAISRISYAKRRAARPFPHAGWKISVALVFGCSSLSRVNPSLLTHSKKHGQRANEGENLHPYSLFDTNSSRQTQWGLEENLPTTALPQLRSDGYP